VDYKKNEAKIETIEMKFLRRVIGCTRKNQIRYTKIRQKLNIFNLNNNILKSKSRWKYYVQRMEDERIQKKMFKTQGEDET
jgi:hypothetical protein